MKQIKNNLSFGQALDLVVRGGYMRQEFWDEDESVFVENIASENSRLIYKNNTMAIKWLPTYEQLFANNWQIHQ